MFRGITEYISVTSYVSKE